MKKLVSASLIAVLLGGCASMKNENGEYNKTSTYGGMAAVAGAAAGALLSKNNRGKGALVGAALAGTAGAGYGYYVDKQEAQLRESMKGSGVEVRRDGDQLNIVMPGSITFATGQAAIQPSFQSTLSQLAANFSQFKDSNLIITGHTDSVGSYKTNQVLSQRRADSVATYLRSNGVDSSRIQAFGAGPDSPVADNVTESGKAQNRRVEIKLVQRNQASAQR